MHKILFQIGSFTLYSYGLFVAIGFLLGTVLILRVSERYGICRDDIFDCLIWVLVGGIAGGRLLFVAINFHEYSINPIRILFLNEGGLAVQGAIVAGIFSCWVFCKIKKMNFLKTLDLLVPYVALGQAIGRIGCFFNGCCFGKVIETGFGVIFPGQSCMRIPTQLYSSFVLVVIFALLIYVRDKKKYDGYIFFLYCGLYSIFRFLMDYLRGDDLFSFYEITLSQMISIFIFSLSLLFILLFNRKKGCKS